MGPDLADENQPLGKDIARHGLFIQFFQRELLTRAEALLSYAALALISRE